MRYHVTSDDTSHALSRYNCIAHAAGENNRWWWPEGTMPGYVVYWPRDAAPEVTLEAFIDAFKTKDYLPCDDMNIDLEPGYEKVVIYVGTCNEPTHAARQLESGVWTSKLGDWEDIEHKTLTCLNSHDYGTIGKVLKRPATQFRGGV